MTEKEALFARSYIDASNCLIFFQNRKCFSNKSLRLNIYFTTKHIIYSNDSSKPHAILQKETRHALFLINTFAQNIAHPALS